MTFRYDRDADALEIVLVEGGIVARTRQIDAGTLLDVDAAGRILSIEVLQPARAWPLEQVLDEYEVAEADADVLRALWGDSKPYPFADSGSALVPA